MNTEEYLKAKYERERTDWRSLFVYDPMTKVTALIGGASLDDVERRLRNYIRKMDSYEAPVLEPPAIL